LVCEGEEGFDMKFAKEGMWGRGIYFARNASYSHKYSHLYPNGQRGMYLANVILGKTSKIESNKELK
jgi:hypothetical protein